MGISKLAREQRNAELKGKKMHYLKLIEPFQKKAKTRNVNEYWWKCECVCGNFIERREQTLLHSYTKSCGCQHPMRGENRIAGTKHFNFAGCGELNSSYFSTVKDRVITRGYDWNLDITFLWELFLKQNCKCAISGLDISFCTARERKSGKKEQTASIDRKDSSKGYLKDNVQWVHKDVNFMKQQFDQEKFIQLCKLIAENN